MFNIPPDTCPFVDSQVGNEIIPYGLAMTQANSPKISSSSFAPIIVCIIDSGIDRNAADLAYLNASKTKQQLRGCVPEDALDPGGCNLPTLQDSIGQGTAVAGIIAAKGGNNKGVAGVLPNGTDIYSVRVYDKSVGNVEGLGGDRMRAYTVCEGHLRGRIAATGDPYRMVVLVNIATPEPYEPQEGYFSEQDWLSTASTADDIMFVAPGTAIAPAAAPATAGGRDGQADVYPAKLQGVLSVGAVDCKGAAAASSSMPAWINITAPGVDVLSITPSRSSSQAALLTIAKPQPSSGSSSGFSSKLQASCLLKLQSGEAKHWTGNACIPPKCSQNSICVVDTPNPQAPSGAVCLATLVVSATAPAVFSNIQNCSGSAPPLFWLKNGQWLQDLVKKGTQPVLSVTLSSAVEYKTGPAYAAAYVAGAAARLWAAAPSCNASQITSALTSTTKGMLLQTQAAFNVLQKQPCFKAPPIKSRAVLG